MYEIGFEHYVWTYRNSLLLILENTLTSLPKPKNRLKERQKCSHVYPEHWFPKLFREHTPNTYTFI